MQVASIARIHGEAKVAVVPTLATEIHSDTETHLTEILRYEEGGALLRRTPAPSSVGRHFWLELVVPGGDKARALVVVTGRDAETTSVRIKHMWPKHRALWHELVSAQV